MSKSGSRYGRRSNWFKIHCLLQEQQQQAQQAAAQHNGHQKPPALSPNSLNLMRHPSYSSNIFSRPPCTKEELMMLRLDEYVKHPATASSPSISSPDSHNSDSSIEIGDKRNSLLNKQKHAPNTQQSQSQSQQSQQSQHHHRERSSELQAMSGSHLQSSPLALSKELFLPMQFAGFPGLGMMPPPGFLAPPTHFLLSSYHNALYEQNQHLMQQQVQQGLLKTSDLPLPIPQFSAKSPSIGEKDDARDCDEDVEVERHSPRSNHLLHHQHPFLQSHHLHRSDHRENGSSGGGGSLKRNFSEALLEQQRKQISLLTKLPKNHNNNHHHLSNNNNNNNISKDNNKSLSHHHLSSSNSHHHHHRHQTTSSSNKSDVDEDEDIDINESDEVLTPPRSPKSPSSHVRAATTENNPIDLSMKSGSSTKSDDINHNYYKIKTNNKSASDSLGSLNGNSIDSNDSNSNDHKITINNNNNDSTKSTARSLIHCHDVKDSSNNSSSNSRKHQNYEKNRGGVKNESDDSDDIYRHNIDVAASDDRSEEVERELKRKKLHLAAPLDLTTKV